MSLVVNNNMMAANTARNLNAHYGRLATSTQRLSSGLRVNSAADDAAGLAIRELQRADIAALHQGARNANDAISMIQVADGSLGIIDEKLIRMKELAEQAATGTYDSTQRLMIESEYQAMASEITRIANATDFNGTKLLDGTLSGDHDGSKLVSEGKIKIHFGTGNDSAEDYYYIEIGECTSEAFGLGNNSTWDDVQRRGAAAFKDSLLSQIKNDKAAGKITDEEAAQLLSDVDKAVAQLNGALDHATDYKEAWKLWATDGTTGFMEEGKNWVGNSSLMEDYLAAAKGAGEVPAGPTTADDIVTKIQNAIIDSVPTDTEVAAMWPADNNASDVARIQNELWTKIETAARNSAKEAGLLDEDITALIDALKTNWDGDPNATPAINPVKPENVNDPANAKLLSKAIETLAVGTPAAAPNPAVPSVVATAINTPAVDGKGAATENTIAEKAAYRNQAMVEYAAAPVDNKPTIGPTDPQQIVAQLQSAIDEAWKSINTEATGALVDATGASLASKEFDKVLDALGAKAKELGFKDSEITAIRKLISDESANIFTTAAGLKTAGAIDTDPAQAAIDWAKSKDALKKALTALNGTSGITNLDAGFVGEPGNNTAGGTGPLLLTKTAEVVALRNEGYEAAKKADKLDEFWNGLRETEKQKLQYAWGQAAIYNLANAKPDREPGFYGIGSPDFEFNTSLGFDAQGIDSIFKDNDMLSQAFKDMEKKVGHMDFAGHTVETQEDAQQALDAINDAIVSKDKIRAHLGAAQNRLENTVSNLNIQAENLQAAESRISDVDVATEMTQFVRNQILTQSAVAMLSQANSLPQMAMQLIGG